MTLNTNMKFIVPAGTTAHEVTAQIVEATSDVTEFIEDHVDMEDGHEDVSGTRVGQGLDAWVNVGITGNLCEAWMDTAYGHEEGATTVHARALSFLSQKYESFMWQNEFTGEWHSGFDGEFTG